MTLTPAQISCRQRLMATGAFNVHTLWPGEDWVRPANADVRHVLSLITLNDMRLAARLCVTERTVRKWRSGIVFIFTAQTDSIAHALSVIFLHRGGRTAGWW